MHKALPFLGATVVLCGLCGCDYSRSSTANTAPPPQASVAPSLQTAPQESKSVPQPQPKNWDYDNEADEMGRGEIKRAVTRSSNAVFFHPPYDGAQHGLFIIRDHPKYGKDLILQIHSGQFLFNIDDQCRVVIRLDDQKPQSFTGTQAADRSTTVCFIHGYTKLLPQIKRAKTMKIEAQFYEDGDQVFSFDVEGLQWEDTAQKIRRKAP